MRDEDNIQAVSQLRPGYMGFIFYAGSPRYVGNDFSIPVNFPAETKRVGVFVNETNETILRKAQAYALDFVQLHGDESVLQCKELKSHQVRIIKAFSVDDNMDFDLTKPYAGVVDFFLFDTKGKLYGGNAKTFNWSVLTKYDQKVPFFLSGGITPDNIDSIQNLDGLNLQAIDVNSGVEIQPAVKDINKIMVIKAILNSKKLK